MLTFADATAFSLQTLDRVNLLYLNSLRSNPLANHTVISCLIRSIHPLNLINYRDNMAENQETDLTQTSGSKINSTLFAIRKTSKEYLAQSLQVYIDNFLICSYALIVIISLLYPFPGKSLSSYQVGNNPFHLTVVDYINNVLIFLISGLQLRTEDISNLWNYKTPVIYGIVTINFLTTLLAFALIRLPFPTKEFSIGLMIFATVPTTLGVGVALTTQAKGDTTLSLFLTIASNMLGIITIPYLLTVYSSALNVNIDPVRLFIKLIFSVFIPSILGISLRHHFQSVKEFMKRNKTQMSIFSNCNIVCIVWTTLSSAQKTILQQNGLEIFCVLIAVTMQHVIYLLSNYYTAKYVLKLELKQLISITIMSSQKSSPVALVVISNIAKSSKDAGLYIIPCILGQLIQIFIGAIVARYFTKVCDKYDRLANEQSSGERMETALQDIHQSNGVDQSAMSV